MYTLDFTNDSNGILPTTPGERYRVCLQSIHSAQRAVPFESWDDVIGLLDKLNSIRDERTNEICPGGGIIQLKRGEMHQLKEYIRTGAWVPQHLKAVRTTFDWLTETREEVEIVKSEAGNKKDKKLKLESDSQVVVEA